MSVVRVDISYLRSHWRAVEIQKSPFLTHSILTFLAIVSSFRCTIHCIRYPAGTCYNSTVQGGKVLQRAKGSQSCHRRDIISSSPRITPRWELSEHVYSWSFLLPPKICPVGFYIHYCNICTVSSFSSQRLSLPGDSPESGSRRRLWLPTFPARPPPLSLLLRSSLASCRFVVSTRPGHWLKSGGWRALTSACGAAPVRPCHALEGTEEV